MTCQARATNKLAPVSKRPVSLLLATSKLAVSLPVRAAGCWPPASRWPVWDAPARCQHLAAGSARGQLACCWKPASWLSACLSEQQAAGRQQAGGQSPAGCWPAASWWPVWDAPARRQHLAAGCPASWLTALHVKAWPALPVPLKA